MNGCETVESASDELLLRTLYARGVTLRQCTDVDDKGERCERAVICSCGPKDDRSAKHMHELKSRHLTNACLCFSHIDARRNNLKQRWCSNRVVLPNGDLQRCQRTGPYSAEFGSFLCANCLVENQEAKKENPEWYADKEKVAV